MIDVSSLELHWRGYPVTLVSDGVAARLRASSHPAGGVLHGVLQEAVDTAESDEPSGWLFESHLAGFAHVGLPDAKVWIERFGGVRDLDIGKHEDGQWSVYLPSER